MMVPDSRLADSEKKEATLCLEDLRQIQPEHFGLPAFKYSKVCVFVPQSRQSLLSFHIPDICHGRHGHVRVNFFLAGVNFYRFNAKIGNLLCILSLFTRFFENTKLSLYLIDENKSF